MTPIWPWTTPALAGLLLFTVLGCDRNEPTRPQPRSPLASIHSVWPNDDGRAWTYSLVREQWRDTSSIGIFQNLADVPPAPTLASMQALFPALVKGDAATVDTGSLTLRFAGQVMTGSGVTGQNLQESASVGGMRFLSGGGGAWKKTPSAILRYGDWDTFPNWEYLRADLVPGAEFSRRIQFGATLSGRLVGRKNVVTPFGTFADAIECFYLLDYGAGSITDNPGNVIGYLRDISCGTVSFVDGLGPVACSERDHLRVGRNGTFSNGRGGGTARLTAYEPRTAQHQGVQRHR